MANLSPVTEWVEETLPSEWVKRTGFMDVAAEHKKLVPGTTDLKIATWNVAAINNNPFEYWMTYPDDPRYDKMMKAVEDFVCNPGDKDVTLVEIFSDEMFAQLDEKMAAANWSAGHRATVAKIWHEDYKNRKVMSEFLKDKALGKKRLMSMGDRVTNTLATIDRGTIYRPTIINAYTADMSTPEKWWASWLTFIFDTIVTVKSKKGEVTEPICDLLIPIKKAKYEAITLEEEEVSIPLQTLCLALFDRVLLYAVEIVAPGNWTSIKSVLCENLILRKSQRCCDVLSKYYKSMDVMCLQEVSASMYEQLLSQLGSTYHIVWPQDADGTRDQNSVLLLLKSRFDMAGHEEITQQVIQTFDKADTVAAGDLLIVKVKGAAGDDYVIASFHGDSNGLATKDVTNRTMEFVNTKYPSAKFIWGLDANTTSKSTAEKYHVTEFAKLLDELGLSSNWGNATEGNYTSYIGRSFLQPQLQKGIPFNDLITKGDRDLKDYILFKSDQFSRTKFWKDCSGSGQWLEGTIMPSINFPSDHAVLAVVLSSLS